jgi:thioredoxin reductase (NADPH)
VPAIFNRKPSAAPAPLRLLGREDCHLCEVVQRDLDILGVAYEVVDVDQDDALQERYGDLIPVLMHGETEIARAPIERSRLEKALAHLRLTGARR